MEQAMKAPAVEPEIFPAEPWEEYGERLEEFRAEAVQPYQGETYYSIPTLNHSHYQWRTSVAFFLNCIGGGTQIVATVADLLGGEKDRPFVRAGRYAALAAGGTSTAVLISALHTPGRWFNMLRMFKKTSPMSIGIWAITPFGILSGLAAVSHLQESRGFPISGRMLGRLFGIPAALLGTVVMTYMGTEQEETNMPLWADAFPLLAPFYAAAGMSASAAALVLVAELTDTPESMKRSLNRLSLVSGISELVLGGMLRNRWRRLPETRFFEQSGYGGWFRQGYMHAGVIAPLILNGVDMLEGGSRRRSVITSLARLTGFLILQLVMVYAGRDSGRRAREYFEYTRPERLEGREIARTGVGKSSMKTDISNHRKATLPVWLGLGVSVIGAAVLLFGKRR